MLYDGLHVQPALGLDDLNTSVRECTLAVTHVTQPLVSMGGEWTSYIQVDDQDLSAHLQSSELIADFLRTEPCLR